MKFSGKNLELLRSALDYATSGLRSEIGMCPDVVKYEDAILEAEQEIEQIEKIKARIDKALPVFGGGF